MIHFKISEVLSDWEVSFSKKIVTVGGVHLLKPSTGTLEIKKNQKENQIKHNDIRECLCHPFKSDNTLKKCWETLCTAKILSWNLWIGKFLTKLSVVSSTSPYSQLGLSIEIHLKIMPSFPYAELVSKSTFQRVVEQPTRYRSGQTLPCSIYF